MNNAYCFTAPPGRPAMLEIESVTKNSISVRWEPPTRDGGQPVTGYVLERREAHLGIWHNVMKLGATQTRYCITHLLESNDYMFRVAAENREGTGDFRQTIKPHKPLETPGKALRIDGIIHYLKQKYSIQQCSKNSIQQCSRIWTFHCNFVNKFPFCYNVKTSFCHNI